MKETSDTPRTDALAKHYFTPHHCGYEDLARQLERELAALRATVAECSAGSSDNAVSK